jgi:hypothetical protein
LGSRRPGGDWSNVGKNLWRGIVHTYLSVIGLTGSELNLTDQAHLLERMASDPEYVDPLNDFETRTLVSVVWFDTSVPFSSSSITNQNRYTAPEYTTPKFDVVGYDGFGKKHAELFEKVQLVDLKKFDGFDNTNGWKSDNVRHLEYYETMLKNLNKIDWRRIDVQFSVDTGYKFFTIHDLIICKESKSGFLMCDHLKKAGADFQNFIKEVYIKDLM